MYLSFQLEKLIELKVLTYVSIITKIFARNISFVRRVF